jgi:hypothetical protein
MFYINFSVFTNFKTIILLKFYHLFRNFVNSPKFFLQNFGKTLKKLEIFLKNQKLIFFLKFYLYFPLSSG